MLDVQNIDFSDFYFNGHYLSEFDAEVAGKNGLSPFSAVPAIDIKTEKILGKDGELVVNTTFNPRTFVVPIYVHDLERLREIATWLGVKKPTDFYFKDDLIKIKAMPSELIEITPYNMEGLTEIKFIAHDPYFYLINEQSQVLTIASDAVDTTGNVIHDSTLTAFNGGSCESYPLIKVNGTGDIKMTINNIHYILKDVDEYVYIDSFYCTVYKGDTVKVNKIGNFLDGFTSKTGLMKTVVSTCNPQSTDTTNWDLPTLIYSGGTADSFGITEPVKVTQSANDGSPWRLTAFSADGNILNFKHIDDGSDDAFATIVFVKGKNSLTITKTSYNAIGNIGSGTTTRNKTESTADGKGTVSTPIKDVTTISPIYATTFPVFTQGNNDVTVTSGKCTSVEIWSRHRFI